MKGYEFLHTYHGEYHDEHREVRHDHDLGGEDQRDECLQDDEHALPSHAVIEHMCVLGHPYDRDDAMIPHVYL